MTVINKMLEAGNNKVWDKVPQVMDVRKYRSDYAITIYKLLAREQKDIPKKQQYHCRVDLKNVCYDKKAMKTVQLGSRT